ncbi:MAG: hypothetical protein KME57_05710 [Scytonema hyalinum WJT4-NPBG1]|nr:hypothetical protein [Scytonema hyalinum WJT4-NPBG1]
MKNQDSRQLLRPGLKAVLPTGEQSPAVGKPYQERCLTATLSHVFVKHVDEGKTALPASTIVTAVRHFPSFQPFG